MASSKYSNVFEIIFTIQTVKVELASFSFMGHFFAPAHAYYLVDLP